MLCVQCLKTLTGKKEKRGRSWGRGLVMLTQGILGFLVLWYAYYLVGQTLLSIPHTFHEGTIWEENWWDEK